jgi:peroxiredoxin
MLPETEDFPEAPAGVRAASSRTRLVGLALIFAGILVIAVFGIDWGFLGGNDPAAQIPAGTTIGRRAPDFDTIGLDGNTLALSDFKGKFVLLNFWATWCSPCRVEMPFLQARHEQYPADLVIVGVDFDEPAELVASFVEEYGLSFEIALDPGGLIQDQYEIRGYPTSIFLDRDGVIREIHIGVMSEGQLDGYLADLGLD